MAVNYMNAYESDERTRKKQRKNRMYIHFVMQKSWNLFWCWSEDAYNHVYTKYAHTYVNIGSLDIIIYIHVSVCACVCLWYRIMLHTSCYKSAQSVNEMHQQFEKIYMQSDDGPRDEWRGDKQWKNPSIENKRVWAISMICVQSIQEQSANNTTSITINSINKQIRKHTHTRSK